MKQRYIYQLAHEFRNAFEVAKKKIKCSPYYAFPRGCCGVASELLSQYLFENGIRNIEICDGDYYYDYGENQYPHTWILIDGEIIVDITADQFIGKVGFESFHVIDSCYVGYTNAFYDLFEPRNVQYGKFVPLSRYKDTFFKEKNEKFEYYHLIRGLICDQKYI